MKFRFLGYVYILLFAFQSCTPFETHQNSSVYPYQSEPEIFFDLKLVSVSVDELGRQKYVFDLVTSYVKNLNQQLTYQLDFSTLDFPGVCQSVFGQAQGSEKHVQAQCLMPTPGELYVQLEILGPSGEQVLRQFRF